MPLIQLQSTDGKPVLFSDEPLASGGEKVVFSAADGESVVLFYRQSIGNRAKRRERLVRVIDQYAPRHRPDGQFWNRYFYWPSALIDLEGDMEEFAARHELVFPLLGMVCPAYDNAYFFSDTRGRVREKSAQWFSSERLQRFVPPEVQGNLRGRLLSCAALCRSVRYLHTCGLAHADLSDRNVLIDPVEGTARLIDVDSLVVKGISMPSVMGTPGFMAPEILVAGEHANRLTDLHSLAVLLYQLLFRRHPLRGKRVLSTKSVVEDEMLSLGQKPLFVEDPNDDSNRPGELAETIATLGIPLERLFLEAFCEGLAYPELRPSAEAWERAFLRTMDYLVPRQDGDWEIRPQQHCQNPEQAYLQFFAPRDEQEDLDEGHALALYHGCPIYRWHLERNTTREYENIDPQSRLGIVFRSGERWVFANEQVEHLLDNQRRTLPSGALIDLAQAGTLDYSSKRFGRRLVYSRGKSASIGTSTS